MVLTLLQFVTQKVCNIITVHFIELHIWTKYRSLASHIASFIYMVTVRQPPSASDCFIKNHFYKNCFRSVWVWMNVNTGFSLFSFWGCGEVHVCACRAVVNKLNDMLHFYILPNCENKMMRFSPCGAQSVVQLVLLICFRRFKKNLELFRMTVLINAVNLCVVVRQLALLSSVHTCRFSESGSNKFSFFRVCRNSSSLSQIMLVCFVFPGSPNAFLSPFIVFLLSVVYLLCVYSG